MSRTWKLIEISVFAACLVAAVAIVGTASAQDNQSNRDDDSRESTAESNRDDSRDEESRDRRETREDDEQQARDTKRDQDERRDSRSERDRSDADGRSDRDGRGEERSRLTTRDEFRRAPDTIRRQSAEFDSRQSDEFGRSDEQGGLGVSVVDDEQGVRVVRVYSNTPAQEMGLRSGDRITHVDGREVASARDFIARIRSMEPGEEVELDIMRNRDERSLTGELESRAKALPTRDQQSWQGGQIVYDDSRTRGFSFGESERGGDALNRLYAVERQLEQLRQELQQLKSSLERQSDGGYNQTSDRESTVIYYENQPRSGDSRFSTRQSQFESQPRQDRDIQRGPRLIRPNEDRSPGGETGEDRLRPSAQQLNER